MIKHQLIFDNKYIGAEQNSRLFSTVLICTSGLWITNKADQNAHQKLIKSRRFVVIFTTRTRAKNTKIFFTILLTKHTKDEKLKYLVYWNMVLKVDKMVKDGPCKRLKIVYAVPEPWVLMMMRLWTWYCKSTIDDETLDLILQAHYCWWDFGLDTASPLRCSCESSPHNSDVHSTWWWGGDWQFSEWPALTPVFCSLGPLSSELRVWPTHKFDFPGK